MRVIDSPRSLDNPDQTHQPHANLTKAISIDGDTVIAFSHHPGSASDVDVRYCVEV